MSRSSTILSIVLFAAVGSCVYIAALTGNPAQADDADDTQMRAVIGGLIIEPETEMPVVLLMDEAKTRYMPIFIGENEAQAIFRYHHKMWAPRPLTHDLIVSMVETLGAKITRVTVTKLEAGTYFAEIEITRNGEVMKVDARPSDSMAIALKTGVPVYVAQQVFDEASRPVDEGLEIPHPPERAPLPEDAI